jgi:hypothetical protein
MSPSGDPPRVPEILEQIVGYVDLIYALGGIIFIVLGIYIGFMYMSSRGDEEQLKQVQERLKYWVLGFVLFFLSATIVAFIYQLFGVHECGDPSRPIVKPGFGSFFVDCPD